MDLLPASYENIMIYVIGCGLILSAFTLMLLMVFNFSLADRILTKLGYNPHWCLIAFLSISIGGGIIQSIINAVTKHGMEREYESILIVDYINWLIRTFG